MNWDAARFALDAAQWLFTMGIGVYAWAATRGRATTARLETQATALADAERRLGTQIADAGERRSAADRRLAVLEQRLAACLTHGDLTAVHERISGLARDVNRMAGALEASKEQLTLLNQHLLRGSNH